MSVKCIFVILLLALCSAAAEVTVTPDPASAQGGPGQYVDVEITLSNCGGDETSNVLTCVNVANLGSLPAYDVEVSVEQRAAGIKQNFRRRPNQPPGATFSQAANTPARDHVVTIAVLPGFSQLKLRFRPSTPLLSVMSARVTGLSSYEDPFRKGNNRDELWYEYSLSKIDPLTPNYYVVVSLDEVSGRSTNVVVTARRSGGLHNPGGGRVGFFSDGCVDVVLPPGVTPASAPTFSSPGAGWAYKDDMKCPKSIASAVSGSFDIGESGTETLFRMTLPVTVTGEAVREGRCVNVEIFADPPTGAKAGQDVASDNVAEACLGASSEPFESAEVEIFTIFPCVGITDSPCDSSDDVRVRAVVKDTNPEGVVPSGTAVIHVPDGPSRMYDSHANSVNSGTEVSWQIPVIWTADKLSAVNTEWSNLRDGFTASGTSNGAPPGRVHIRAFEDTSFEMISKMTPDTAPPWTGEGTADYNPRVNNGPVTHTAEFEKLGTYKLDFTAKLTRATADGDENCDPDGSNVNQRFCATETYTFHVGPIADLEVRDGGASSKVSTGQRAFNIAAVNNGPDASEGAEVTVSLPSGVNITEALPSAGSYDTARGVWSIGRFSPIGRQPTLTLITDAEEGARITASIAIDDTKPYTVCIGSDGADLDHDNRDDCEDDTTNGGDWHEGTVFDHLDSNNTASIAARSGLAGGVPDTAPGMVQAVSLGGNANIVTWSEPESGSKHDELGPVRSWDIEYSENSGVRWTPLIHGYNGINNYRYAVDYNAPADSMRQYRVRARYATRPGDWTVQSVPGAQATAAAGDPGVTIRPTSLSIREGSRGSYSVRLDSQPTGKVVIDVSNSNPDVRLSDNANRLTFTPSNWSRPQTVYVTAADDGDTADDTDTITHVINQVATSADYNYFVLPDVAVTITDNDVAVRFTVGRSGITELGVDEGGSATYELALGTRPEQDVQVSLTFPRGIITASPTNLTFTPENYNVPQTITVTGTEDEDSVDEDLGFIAHSFSGGYAEEAWLNVTVTDDDRAGVSGEVELYLSDLSGGWCPGQWPEELSGAEITVTGYPEEAGGCFYELRLKAAPTGNVTVGVSASPSGKVELDTTFSQFPGEETPGRLIFTQENWRDPQVIGFWPVHDPDGVHNNDFTISHSASGGGYNGVVIPDIAVGVVDADRDYIGIQVDTPHGGLAVWEADQSTGDEEVYNSSFYVWPRTQPLGTVTVSMSSDNPDVTLSPSSLSFTPSNWDQGVYEGYPGRQVIVRARDDDDSEHETARITFTVTSSDPDYNGMVVDEVEVQVADNDTK